MKSMETRNSAAEALKTLLEVIERVRARDEVFVVEREGQPICRIEPIASSKCTVRDLMQVLQSARRPDNDYLDTVEEVTRRQQILQETPWELRLPRVC